MLPEVRIPETLKKCDGSLPVYTFPVMADANLDPLQEYKETTAGSSAHSHASCFLECGRSARLHLLRLPWLGESHSLVVHTRTDLAVADLTRLQCVCCCEELLLAVAIMGATRQLIATFPSKWIGSTRASPQLCCLGAHNLPTSVVVRLGREAASLCQSKAE